MKRKGCRKSVVPHFDALSRHSRKGDWGKPFRVTAKFEVSIFTAPGRTNLQDLTLSAAQIISYKIISESAVADIWTRDVLA
jgi:hypothetical protein